MVIAQGGDEGPSLTGAGFGRRFIAYVIDWAILGAAFELLRLAILPTALRDDPDNYEAYSGDLLAFSMAFGLLLFVYHAGLESSRLQATLGKAALGLRVTGLAGERISLWTAVLRNWPDWIFCPILLWGAVSSAETYQGVVVNVEAVAVGLVVLSCLPAAFTRRRQAAHDILARCLVVPRDA